MPALDDEPRARECRRQVPLDAHRVRSRDVLQMQHRADQQLLTALQHAARRADACRGAGRSAARAGTRSSPHRCPAGRRRDRCSRAARGRCSAAHASPPETSPRRRRRAAATTRSASAAIRGSMVAACCHKSRERRLDVAGEGIAHPPLVNAVRASDAIAGRERRLESRLQLGFLCGPQWTRGHDILAQNVRSTTPRPSMPCTRCPVAGSTRPPRLAPR